MTKTARNAELRRDYAAGVSETELAAKYTLSKQRVGQLVRTIRRPKVIGAMKAERFGGKGK